MATLFMKPSIDAPADQVMRFFEPDLYLRFNSPNDDVADRANEEWEQALDNYELHLRHLRGQMPEQVKALADLCLHDCLVLGWDDAIEPVLRPTIEPLPVWSAFSVLSVRRGGEIVSLNYILWDKIRRCAPPSDWPVSKSRPHWLYDEVDAVTGKPGNFLHRILFSDGTAAEIPFAIVFLHILAWEPEQQIAVASPALRQEKSPS